ncbi:MAG: DUF192 domain-containing protein [Spirochaetaceae bacterium]|jgi:uncharacterized membrane protein (UPF0127 family)|nr:DUF192 domain-containing protein [Spirochaetaceae bacterium]
MNFQFNFVFRFFIFIFLFVFISCTPAEQRPQPKLETKRIIIVNQEGDEVDMIVELARASEEQRMGLMFRKKLDDGEGMLFVYDRDQILSFWMKNTIIPLSIAFISRDGQIIEIKDMQPQSIQSIRSSRSARYALEAPQGWFERSGISAGCVLQM